VKKRLQAKEKGIGHQDQARRSGVPGAIGTIHVNETGSGEQPLLLLPLRLMTAERIQ